MLSPLSTEGELESLCFNAVAEGLHIEFKEKEDAATATLGKTDRKGIAQAVSSFANSDGGTVIFGIRTARRADADVASTLKPIADIDQFELNFRTVCSLNVSPQLDDIVTRVIHSDGASSAGFLICEVRRSERRPHMSTAAGVHTYFRRSFEGSVPMTPSEIRDQILAVRDAVLEPVITYPAGGSFSPGMNWISASISVGFRLKNTGQALCRNPFLRVNASCELHSNHATYDGALECWKTDFPYGTLIHVDDQKSCLSLSFNACVRFDTLWQLFTTGGSDLTEAVLIFPGSQNHHVETVSDKVSLEGIDLHLRYGAENAPAADRL